MSGKSPTDQLTPVEGATGRTVYYDEDRQTYHAWFDDDEYEPVSTALLDAVASVLDVDPLELEPLSACIEPDALNELVTHWQTGESGAVDGSVSFTFSDCVITVRADGEIVIDPEQRRLTEA
ncbi:HalOD1 output domain-containing protein [Natrarchaeobius oligotrophus]|uniref:Halobacterial output domain-containing protein n=1 Tax=Natrarchaeobius chitinivorans TaxID=1679083 RepID=A0A3N6N5T7_NATCH|nr:HalOD1 output domain-containing protein [Natrarchaeobius chitinivorans]RQH03227.1 hypothetical protein EA472_01175 [Natrarchaeobius chitinivorans]